MSHAFASRLAVGTVCFSMLVALGCSSGGGSGGSGGAMGSGGSGSGSGGSGSGGSGSGGSGSGGSGSGGSGTGGSGSGGAVVDSGTDVADAPGEKTSEVGDAGGDSSTGSLTFSSSTLRMMGTGLVFPASASAPMNQSPAFTWSGAPAGTLSFVITLKDLQGDTHWAIWDIPPTTTMIAAGLPRGPIATPAGAKQKAIYGDTRGYEGPGAPPPPHNYEFELWALSVATLPANVASMTPAQMRSTGLPPLKVSPTSSVKILAKGNLGGI